MEVRARKIHKCNICGGNIQKGEIYEFQSWRRPAYLYDEVGYPYQIGIYYDRHRQHIRNCYPELLSVPNPKQYLLHCRKGDHSHVSSIFSEEVYCEWCGIEIKNIKQ